MRKAAVQAMRLALLGAAMAAAAGCSGIHHRGHAKCREPSIGADTTNLPPLKVPAGLDQPDTRNAIKIPPLTEPERPRAPRDPCLSSPPSYKS